MYRIILTLLLLTSLLFGDYAIQRFSVGNSYPQPQTNYLLPTSGTFLTPVTEPRSQPMLRRRFSSEEYRLYRGKLSPMARDAKGNLQKFIRPRSIPRDQFYKLKYYDRERMNSHGDITECYFHEDTLFVVGLVRLSYNQYGEWLQLAADLPEKIVSTGDIAVTTNPAGAHIYLNGMNRNVETPNYLTELQPGVHRLRLMHPDYAPRETTVTVIPGEILQVNLHLKSRYGSASFSGFPRGASVRLDGRVVGQLPCDVEQLAPGSYTFTVDSPFHSRKRVPVEIRSGSKTSVSVMLSKAYGVIHLPPVPNNTPWQINGENVASGPLRFNQGTHRIFWSGGRYFKPIDTIVTIKLGDTVSLNYQFAKRTGGVKVLPLPMACSLYVNGIYHGEAPKVVDDLPVGKHTIELRRKGFQPFHTSVMITGESVIPLRCKLQKAGTSAVAATGTGPKSTVENRSRSIKKASVSSTGEVSFVSFPPCAEVYSGDSLVAITGKGSVKVPVGRYQFRFVNGENSTVRTVSIASGDRKAVLVHFGE